MEIFKLILCIALPMLAVQIGYRLLDRDGARTAALGERFPFIRRHKFLTQILFPLAFIAVFGAVAAAAGLNRYVFFLVCGTAVGAVNGMAVTLMALEDREAEKIDEEQE